MNLFDEAIKNGFVPDRKIYSTKNNWFGLSLYEPDLFLTKGNKTISASLGGVLCSFFTGLTEHSRLIRLQIGKEVHYQTFTGIMPDEDVVKAFLSD